MILALAILLATADEPRVLNIRAEGDGEKTPCLAVINGQSIDPRDEAELTAAFAPYPVKDWLVELSGNEDVAYRCIGAVIYRIQVAGYQFTKMAFVAPPPEAK